MDDDFWSEKAGELQTDFTRAALEYLTVSGRPDGFAERPCGTIPPWQWRLSGTVELWRRPVTKSGGAGGGLMVNYRYDLDVVEKNHEEFNKTKAVRSPSGVKALMKSL